MGIIRKMIETAKLTAEVANNGLRKFGYQSYDKAKKASETVADEITPAAVKKAKAASKIVSKTVAPVAIKSAAEVYERFKADYGLETAKVLKRLTISLQKPIPEKQGQPLLVGVSVLALVTLLAEALVSLVSLEGLEYHGLLRLQ